MNGPNHFWTRVTSARIVQILVAYLAVSWGILQVADILQQSLELPPWIQPVALLLLVIGFIIIAATAWVQSHRSTAERAARGEVPEAWELQPAEIGQGLARGRLPHLIWARALLGGAVAFLLRHYRSEWANSVVRLKPARVYERSGEAGKARQAYTYFVQSWANADPELQPIVERAKQDIVRLRGDYSP